MQRCYFILILEATQNYSCHSTIRVNLSISGTAVLSSRYVPLTVYLPDPSGNLLLKVFIAGILRFYQEILIS